jgi:hypothetical protein
LAIFSKPHVLACFEFSNKPNVRSTWTTCQIWTKTNAHERKKCPTHMVLNRNAYCWNLIVEFSDQKSKGRNIPSLCIFCGNIWNIVILAQRWCNPIIENNVYPRPYYKGKVRVSYTPKKTHANGDLQKKYIHLEKKPNIIKSDWKICTPTTEDNIYPRPDYEGIVRESYTPRKHAWKEIYIEKKSTLKKTQHHKERLKCIEESLQIW